MSSPIPVSPSQASVAAYQHRSTNPNTLRRRLGSTQTTASATAETVTIVPSQPYHALSKLHVGSATRSPPRELAATAIEANATAARRLWTTPVRVVSDPGRSTGKPAIRIRLAANT